MVKRGNDTTRDSLSILKRVASPGICHVVQARGVQTADQFRKWDLKTVHMQQSTIRQCGASQTVLNIEVAIVVTSTSPTTESAIVRTSFAASTAAAPPP